MNKYIISVVMTRVIPGAMGVDQKGNIGQQQPDISLQNVVGVCNAKDADEAYAKISQRARLQHPDHRIAVKVVIETTAADLDIVE